MATLTVTTIANAGTGSLRETIAAAQSGDTINFAASLANQTIVLASELELPRSITIDGSTAPGLTISGNNAVRVFDVTGTGITVNISNLTIADGRATTGVDEERAGAGIRGASNTVLNVDTVLFENNVAGFAGAIYTGFSSTNTVTNSTFNNNDGTLDGSERGGGAIATKSNGSLTVMGSTFTNNQGINGGAINHLLGNLTIEDSTFIDNTTNQGTGTNTNGYGGAVYVDGANASGPGFTPGSIGGTIAIRDSVFEGNTGKGQGGGLFLFVYDPDELILEDNVVTNNQVIRAANGDALGGGIRIGNGRYRIENTTFANNIAEAQGGGLWVGETATGSITNSTFWQNQAINPTNTQDGLGGGLLFATTSPQQVTNVTIASNQAGGEGGGIVGRSNVTLTNTIVANNTGNNPFGNKQNASDGQGFNASPPPIFADGGGNLQWPAITNNFNDPNITATVVQADPRLGTLTDAGNGVLVVPLLEGSAAIDAGVSTGAPATDQRGQARPVDGDGNGSAIVDMGAFELSGESVVTEIALTIAPSSFSENGGTATGTLTRNTSSGSLVVNLSSSDTGEATVPATVTIPDGATAATFTVTGVDDTILDGSQSVTIAASAVDLPEAIATISITDDEQAAVSLTIAANNANQTEGDSGTKAFAFTVTRSEDTAGSNSVSHTVNWAVTGSGSNPANATDFGGSLPSGVITFAPGEISQTLTIAVGGDTLPEAEETFTVTLSNPSSGATIATATAVGTIVNDDRQTIAEPIVINPLEDISTDTRTDANTIDLFNYFDDPFTTGQVLRFELDATSLGGAITEVLLFDQVAPLTVTNFLNYVEDGDYNNSIIHRSVSDFIIQGGGFTVEGLAATLDNPALAVSVIATDPPVQNEFSADRSNIRGTIAMAKVGGNPDSATSQWFFNLADNAANLDNQNGGFTVFGEVLSQADLTVLDTIAAVPIFNGSTLFGQSAFTNLPLIVENPDEPVISGDENLVRYQTITLLQREELTFAVTGNSNPTLVEAGINGTDLVLDYQPGQVGTANITVQATNLVGETIEDTFSVTISDENPTTIGIEDVVVSENAASTVIPLFEVFTDAEDTAPSLSYSILSNSNTELFSTVGIDPTTGQLTLDYAPDRTGLATLMVQAQDSLGQVVTSSFTVTVLASPTLVLTIAPSSFSENGGTATGTLTRNTSSGSLVVNLSSSDTGEATVPATVTIPDGATAATFTVTGVDDTILDGSQSVTIAASAVDLPEASSTISITDDEQAAVSLTIAANNGTQTEGDSGTKAFTFTVTRSEETAGSNSVSHTVNWAVTGSGSNPANATDFGGSLPSGVVTFAPGETSQTLTIAVGGDTLPEAEETFTVTLSNPSSGATIATATAVGTIVNDDSTTPPNAPVFEVDSNDLISEVFAYDFNSVEAGSVVTIRLVDRNFATEDAFDNLVGLYEIADVNGGIDTNNDGVADLFPSDAAYAQYAITNRVEDFELRAGSLGDPAKNTTIAQFGEVVLTAGKRYAPFLLANGGDLGFDGFITAENVETDGVFNDAADFEYDRVLYFPFQAANPDGTAHLRSFGDNALGYTFGFEDLGSNIGTSDQDFDDIAFTLGVSIDIPNLPTVSLAVSPTTVLENNTANLIYTFSRTGDTTNPLTVNYSVSGTATFNSDYTQSGATSFNATTGSVTFAAGDSTAIVTIVPREDDLAETSETVAFTLTENPAYTVGTSAPVVSTLTDATPDTPDNPAPRLEDIQSTALEDTIVSFSLEDFLSAFSDEEDENDNLKAIRVISLPASGSLSLNTTAVTVGQVIQSPTLSQLRYTPATDRNGDITFQVSAQDDGLGNTESTPATVTIALTAVNDAPSFNLTAEADQVTIAGESITLVDFATQMSAGATNETNQSLTFNITTSGDNIFSTSPQLSREGVLTYAVAAGVTGVATVRLILQDDGGVTNGGSDRSAATTFTITAVSPAAQDAVAQVLVDTDDTGRISSRFAYDLTPAGDGTEVAMQLPENVVQRSEAAFDNLVGLYEIADPQGGIDTNGDGIADLSPENQAEYAEYILNNRVDDFLIRAGSSGNPDRNTTVAQFGDVLLAGGKLYAPFVIANAGAVGFEGFQTLENNETDGIFNDAADVFNDRVMYFAFSAANPDNAEHLQSLGNNTFGFEDLPANLGISDNDFNDAIFQFTFASVG